MTKVMVFNFKIMEYEQVSDTEGKEWIGRIESLNADCVAKHEEEEEETYLGEPEE